MRYKEVKNPYYRSSIAFKLIISDIENNQETIKSFPKHSKKKTKEKYTQKGLKQGRSWNSTVPGAKRE
jgi:hypothetical protein